MKTFSSFTADRLYVNLALLERLADYALHPSDASPPLLPGLDGDVQEFLATEGGAGAAASWLRAFRPAIESLQDFRTRDLAGELRYTSDAEAEVDLGKAVKASETALDAAVSRIKFMHTASRGPGHHAVGA